MAVITSEHTESVISAMSVFVNTSLAIMYITAFLAIPLSFLLPPQTLDYFGMFSLGGILCTGLSNLIAMLIIIRRNW
jgi:ABC-type phosphate/phosphonate transport system permease subunit